MNKEDLIVSYPEFFISEIREDTLWVKFSGNFFHNPLIARNIFPGTELSLKYGFWDNRSF